MTAENAPTISISEGLSLTSSPSDGLPLGGDAVIQNQPWHGYRLNPLVRVVAPDQIDRGEKRHDFDSERHDSGIGASKTTN